MDIDQELNLSMDDEEFMAMHALSSDEEDMDIMAGIGSRLPAGAIKIKPRVVESQKSCI